MSNFFYRALVALLPRRFTARDRAEMIEAHDDRLTAAAPSGRLAVAWTGATEVTDLAVAVVREHLRGSMDATVQDVRVGVRSLRRTPMVTAMAVLSLALGIGVTTSLFSVLDVWLWRPLPVPNQSRLVQVSLSNRVRGWRGLFLSLGDFEDLRKTIHTVDLAVYRRIGASLSTGKTAEHVMTIRASVNLPTVLGVQPVLGRAFRPDEELAGTPGTALLTDAFWRRAWNADPSVPGRSVLIDGESYTIVGVLPPRSTLPNMDADIWLPLRLTGGETRGNHSWRALGLLHPGRDLETVRQDLEAAATTVAKAHHDSDFTDADAQSLHDFYVTGSFKQGSYALGGSVLFVLLIACANIANLLLARGVGRTHEMAVRGALGAGRARVVRQLLVENAILATAGGLGGLAVAWVGIRLLVGFVFPAGEVRGLEYMELDGRVLTAAVALTVTSALLFGLVPSWRTSKVDLRAGLVEGGRATMGSGQGRMGTALVVGEIGLAIALLATTALVVRSLVAMNRLDMGFRTDDALTFAVSLPDRSYPDPGAIRSFHAALATRIGELPGVVAVGANTNPTIGAFSSASYTVDDRPEEEVRERIAWFRQASPGYLRAMGMHMVAGRWFDDHVDRPEGPAAVVVSRPLAQREWGSGAAAVGRTLSMWSTEYRVVGVADVGRLTGPQYPPPSVIFVSTTQAPSPSMYYVVATEPNRTGVAAGVRAVLRKLDPAVAMADVSTLEAEVHAALEPEVVVIEILGALGAMALALTLVGVYGVVAHSVGRRTPEFGLRLALGAEPRSILRLVLAQSAWRAGAGAAGGLILAVGLGKLLSAALVGIRPFDAVALGATALLTVAATGAASWVPAKRAARADPTRSLQER